MLQFYRLNEQQPISNSSLITLENVRSRKITGGTTAIEILKVNKDRRTLSFTNRASEDAYIYISDPTSSETPPAGVDVADYSFVVPAESQGGCTIGVPTGPVKVFYAETADAEFVATEGW